MLISRFICRKRRDGFTLVEVLLSLGITLMIVTSLTGFYNAIAHSQNIKSHHEDIYIGVKQASQYMLGSRYKEVGSRYVYMDFHNQENVLFFEKGRLVKSPGYEILLMNIENGYFEINNEHIYLCFQREQKDYRFLMTYASFYQEDNHETAQ